MPSGNRTRGFKEQEMVVGRNCSGAGNIHGLCLGAPSLRADQRYVEPYEQQERDDI